MLWGQHDNVHRWGPCAHFGLMPVISAYWGSAPVPRRFRVVRVGGNSILTLLVGLLGGGGAGGGSPAAGAAAGAAAAAAAAPANL